jgi:hypothetical protein
MEATQPLRASRGSLAQRFAEYLAARLLRAGFIKARRNPRVGLPAVFRLLQSLQIPAPFDDSGAGRKDADQSKWIHALQWKLGKRFVCDGGRIAPERGFHNFTPADGIAGDAGRDGIPVHEGKGRTGVVDADPGAAAGFRGEQNVTAAEAMSRWSQGSYPSQLLVAVHGEQIAVSTREESDSAHKNQNQIATGNNDRIVPEGPRENSPAFRICLAVAVVALRQPRRV